MTSTLRMILAVALGAALAAGAGMALLACIDTADNCMDTSSCPPPDAGDAGDAEGGP